MKDEKMMALIAEVTKETIDYADRNGIEIKGPDDLATCFVQFMEKRMKFYDRMVNDEDFFLGVAKILYENCTKELEIAKN